MAKAAKYQDYDYALYPMSGGALNVKNEDEDNGYGEKTKITRGVVSTPFGYVLFYSYEYKNHRFSSLEMIKDGRTYYRRFDKALTARGLTAKAKQFSNELFIASK